MEKPIKIQKITDEVWAIVLELSQTLDYALPSRLPGLRARAEQVISDLESLGVRIKD